MPLEPEVQAILKGMEEAGGPAISEMTPEVARQAFEGLLPLQGEPEVVAGVEQREVPGPARARSPYVSIGLSARLGLCLSSVLFTVVDGS